MVGRVLNPVTTQDFLEQYWEKTLLHVQRDKSDHFSDLLSYERIEQILTHRDLYFPDVQLTQHNRVVPVADYASSNNKISPLRVVEQHKLGATLVISQAHRLFDELGQLCRQIQSELQMRCQANVYLTPSDNQGFNAHYDTHDVLILQVQGPKTFNIYSGGPELPFTDDQFDPTSIPDLTLQQSLVLTAGDTLYIPRGVVHDAVTADADSGSSLHVTVGLYPIVVRDLVQELIQVLAEKDSRFRQSVLHGSSTSCIRDVLSADVDDSLVQTSLGRLLDEMSIQADQNCTGLLTFNADDAKTETTMYIKREMIVSVEQEPGKTTLRTFGQVMELGDPMCAAFDWMLQQKSFLPAAVPGLDRQQTDALVQRLIRENIIGQA